MKKWRRGHETTVVGCYLGYRVWMLHLVRRVKVLVVLREEEGWDGGHHLHRRRHDEEQEQGRELRALWKGAMK